LPDQRSRRHVLRSAAVLSGVAAVTPILGSSSTAAENAAEKDTQLALPSTGTHVILLGTSGGPVPMKGRSGIASALLVNGRIYLVDLGPGAFRQFDNAGLSLDNLQAIFITHLHSDHIVDLYTTFWLRFGGFNGMTHAVDVYGPGPAGALPGDADAPTLSPGNPTPGLSDYFDLSMQATAYDLNIRLRDEASVDIRDRVRTHEIELPDVGASPTGDTAPPMEPFPIMSDDRVTVSAILVQHAPVYPSFAFRFDTADGSVVFSGDTGITQNMVTLAQGANLLVHEAIDLEAIKKFGNPTEDELAHHATAHSDVTKLGELAEQAGVRKLVLSHLVPGTTAWPDATWLAKASKGFSGTVIVGRDQYRVTV
jgi:ribonuclease BN (tRNA processing enzyme)